MQDDMTLAPDFFSYFDAALPLLDADPSLWCISSWNDHGQVGQGACVKLVVCMCGGWHVAAVAASAAVSASAAAASQREWILPVLRARDRSAHGASPTAVP